MGQRDSSIGVLVGVGCAGLVVLLVAGGAIFWMFRQRAEQERALRDAVEMREREALVAKERAAQAEHEAQAKRTAAPDPGKEAETDALRARVRELEAKLAKSDARIAELEKAAQKAPEVVAEKGPDPAERLAKAKQELAKLSEQGMFALGGQEFQDLIKELKELGAEGTAMLTALLLQGATAKERFLAGAALEGILDPGSAAALAKSVREDPDALVRRMSSHALAVGQFPEGKDALNTAMLNDADWGVRVNSAYGLAKQGDARGVQEMVKWYEAPTTEAQYKTAILGGIADVGSPATSYIFKNILGSSQDMSALLLAIHGATKSKDASLVPDLQKVMDTSKDQVVKEAAEKAIQALRGY